MQLIITGKAEAMKAALEDVLPFAQQQCTA
jgi:hypothetical protein